MSIALSTCVLFILLIQSVNWAQFLNILFLFPLFGVTAVPAFRIVIVLLTGIYESL